MRLAGEEVYMRMQENKVFPMKRENTSGMPYFLRSGIWNGWKGQVFAVLR